MTLHEDKILFSDVIAACAVKIASCFDAAIFAIIKVSNLIPRRQYVAR